VGLDARRARQRARASLAFHHAAGDAEALARLCAGEWLLWYFVGDAFEGAQWLDRALALGPPGHLLSRVENAYSAVLLVSGEEAASGEFAAAARLHAREIGDGLAESAALITLGNGLMGGADGDVAAVAAWTEAASIAHMAGAHWWEACAIGNLATVALARDDQDEAVRLCESLERLGATSNAIVESQLIRAEVAWLDGDVDRARAQLVLALERQRKTLLSAPTTSSRWRHGS
jgi:hypothetical protein